MDWIRTRERLPTREDAGDWSVVAVLFRGVASTDNPFVQHHRTVTAEQHSHWAKLPDKPEGE